MAEEKGMLSPPRPMRERESTKRQRSNKYCRFHKDKGHITEDYRQLKNAIEKLIRKGYLSEFIDMSYERKGDYRLRDKRR